jgi:hypothetical protein
MLPSGTLASGTTLPSVLFELAPFDEPQFARRTIHAMAAAVVEP